MSIDAQIKKLTRKLKQISEREVSRAGSSSLNKTATHIKGRTVKGVAAEVGIKQKAVRQRLFVARSTAKKQHARVRAYARRGVPVISLLSPSQRVPRKRGKGIKTGRHFFQGAFINTVRRTGQPQVMQRRGQSRYPVEVLKIDIERSARRIMPKVAERAMRDFFKRTLANDLAFRLRKYRA